MSAWATVGVGFLLAMASSLANICAYRPVFSRVAAGGTRSWPWLGIVLAALKFPLIIGVMYWEIVIRHGSPGYLAFGAFLGVAGVCFFDCLSRRKSATKIVPVKCESEES